MARRGGRRGQAGERLTFVQRVGSDGEESARAERLDDDEEGTRREHCATETGVSVRFGNEDELRRGSAATAVGSAISVDNMGSLIAPDRTL